MIDKELVSVLMTAYNSEKYIAQAIESVLASTYKNFEFIIVDDCSIDKTFAIASIFSQKDARIKLYKNHINLGQFANRNKAIKLSIGKYIKFLDSDDLLVPLGLEVMVYSMMVFPDAGIGVSANNDSFSNILPYQLTAHESVLSHYRGENHLCYGPTGSIFKREALIQIGLFEEQYGILSDTLLNIKIASLYPTVLFERKLFFWRRHDMQITEGQKDDVKMIRERYLIMKAVMAYEFSPLSENEVKFIINNFIKINTIHLFKYFITGKFKSAFQIKNDTNLSLKNIFSAFLTRNFYFN